jgi:hypothetical protein
MLSISVAALLLACAYTPQNKKSQNYNLVMCERLKKRGQTLDPENITNAFIKGDGKIVYTFIRWSDLTPNRTYKMKWDWYAPNNYLIYSKTTSFTPTSPNWKVWNGIKTDLRLDWPSGLWIVKVYFNDGFVDEKRFVLADHEEELAELKIKHKVELASQNKTKQDLKPDQSIVKKDSYYSTPVEKNWAVIIGISKYKFAGKEGLDDLIFADDDAKAFARVLINLGWKESHVRLLLNEEATQRNIMIALESWLTKASSNDQIVLFWAGHGFADPEDPEKVYFACYDTDISIPVTGYRMDKVRAALEEREARNVVLFADTCHAGKLITRGDRGLSIAPQINKMRRERNVPKGWIFMVGADTDRKAIEHSSWTNGAFTHCLVKALDGEADGYESVGPKDGIVTMDELRAYLNSAMPEETQRVLGVAKRPIITTSAGDPHIWNLTLKGR